MPIYEYECMKCGNHTEAWQKFSDNPITQCEGCGGKMRKLISQSSFHLKGTGWYVTDYASKSNAQSGANRGNGAESGTQDSGRKPESTSTKESKDTSSKKDVSSKKDASGKKDASSKKDTSGK
jgi:putative FmdB family regulatory protein